MEFMFCFNLRLGVHSKCVFWFIVVEIRQENIVWVNACVMRWIVREWLHLYRVELVCKRTFLSIRHDFVVKGFL